MCHIVAEQQTRTNYDTDMKVDIAVLGLTSTSIVINKHVVSRVWSTTEWQISKIEVLI